MVLRLLTKPLIWNPITLRATPTEDPIVLTIMGIISDIDRESEVERGNFLCFSIMSVIPRLSEIARKYDLITDIESPIARESEVETCFAKGINTLDIESPIERVSDIGLMILSVIEFEIDIESETILK